MQQYFERELFLSISWRNSPVLEARFLKFYGFDENVMFLLVFQTNFHNFYVFSSKKYTFLMLQYHYLFD